MKSHHRFTLRNIAVLVAALAAMVTLVAATSQAGSAVDTALVGPIPAPDAPQPLVITYQGRLLDRVTGEPMPDGVYDAMFRLYSVDAGGAPIWEEKEPIVASKGFFSVVLGNETGNSIDPAMFDGYGRWLSVNIAPDGELLPRVRLAHAPYAIWSNLALNAGNADRLGGYPPSSFRDATNLTAGNLSTDRYHAIDDLSLEGFLNNAAGDLALNNGVVQTSLNADLLDGQHAGGFAASAHNHDSAYVNSTGDTMAGTLILSIPAGGSHGVSAVTASTASGAAAVEAKNNGAGYGLNAYSADSNAVRAEVAGSGPAVYAWNSGATGHGMLSYSSATSNGAAAIAGYALGNAGVVAGIKGQCNSATNPSCYAGQFYGPVYVSGLLSKGGGGFKIDHPLDPQNKVLNHSFVESPDMTNLYNGNVVLDSDGRAWVDLPAWFEALNRDFRYQLTAIGGPGPNLHVAQKIQNNRFQIAGGSPGLEVSWQVTGIRKDAFAESNRIPVEEDKPAADKGTYLHPDAYGQPATKMAGSLDAAGVPAPAGK